MKKHRIIFSVLLLAAAIFLAPYAQLIVKYLVIEPLAYYGYGIQLIAQAIPQSAYWVFLISGLAFIVFLSLVRDYVLSREAVEETRTQKGPVQVLAEHITRTEQSNYFKWLIAKRLAGITLKILVKNNGQEGEHRDFSRIYWNPPQEIEKYLKAGLSSSFMEYRDRGRFFRKRKTTPFDIDLNQVIEYLESELE